jgi:hypothetical protein
MNHDCIIVMTSRDGQPRRRAHARPVRRLATGSLARKFGAVAGAACIATVAMTAPTWAQQPPPQKQPGAVAGLVVMTPNGAATCATWVQWRAPGAHPVDKATIEFWVEGYLSGLAAGSHRDVIGTFHRDALAAWLDSYCTANPQTQLPVAVHALAVQMVRHPGGPL